MAEQKKYFVGIGAQKAGTTWLCRYLDNHPEVGFSPIKELHYFDSVYRKDLCGGFDEAFLARLKNVVSKLDNDLTNKNLLKLCRCLILRLEMVNDGARYKDYFDILIEEKHKVFGEITPSYSLLNEDGFAAIHKMYEDARFIFIMRNPVDRYWSHLRFNETLLGQKKFDARGNVLSKLTDPKIFLRSDYSETLKNLYKVVSEENVKVLFFEKLLHPDSHERELKGITSFLGIEYIESNLSNRINVSKPIELEGELRKKVVAGFAHVYEYVGERFKGKLPENWLEDLDMINRTGT